MSFFLFCLLPSKRNFKGQDQIDSESRDTNETSCVLGSQFTASPFTMTDKDSFDWGSFHHRRNPASLKKTSHAYLKSRISLNISVT